MHPPRCRARAVTGGNAVPTSVAIREIRGQKLRRFKAFMPPNNTDRKIQKATVLKCRHLTELGE
jgi:hypothetical protein